MPVQSKVYNLSGEGVYLDLASSVFIYNGKVIGSMRGKESARLKMYSQEREIFDQGYTKSTGSISYQKTPDFIYVPPGAYIEMKHQIFKPGYNKTGKEKAYMEEVENEQGLAFRYKTYKPEKGNQYGVVMVFSANKILISPGACIQNLRKKTTTTLHLHLITFKTCPAFSIQKIPAAGVP